MIISKVYDTDVLVVGGGGAGISAAISAARGGARVLLASKGQAGNSGNTILIGGSFAMDGHSAYHEYKIKEADPDFTKDVLYTTIVNDGFFLSDQNMVEQFVEESPAIVYEVVKWAEATKKPFEFHSPSIWWMSGAMMGAALRYGLRQASGIEVMNDVIITDLLKENGQVCGAVGIEITTGDILQINAKAVVLGTGGFQPFTLKNTNSDMTGDGIAMALRAGAEVADMEFLLFLMTALEPADMLGSILPIMVVTNPNFKYIATDHDGNELPMPEKLKDLETKSEICKLLHIYYYGKKSFYLKVLNTDEELDLVFDQVIDMFKGFYKEGFYHAHDINEVRKLVKATRKWEVALVNEYSHGGILVNEKMETAVHGLYAAGECASGVFGANRVADAVTEMLVQGYRAGTSASEFAKTVGRAVGGQPASEHAIALAQKLLDIFNNAGGPSVPEAVKQMERISDAGLGCFRTEEGLAQAISDYNTLEKQMPQIALKNKSREYNFEWIQYLQLQNRLTCSKLAAIMGKERKESRGLHLRLDYPDIDNKNWRKRIIAKLSDGETGVKDAKGVKDGKDVKDGKMDNNVNRKIELRSREPIAGKVPAPDYDSIGYEKYLMETDLGLENL